MAVYHIRYESGDGVRTCHMHVHCSSDEDAKQLAERAMTPDFAKLEVWRDEVMVHHAPEKNHIGLIAQGRTC
jgi:hypothetical protein